MEGQLNVDAMTPAQPAVGGAPSGEVLLEGQLRSALEGTQANEQGIVGDGTVGSDGVGEAGEGANSQFTHGARLPDGKVVIDPNQPFDLTQLESFRKFQRSVAEQQQALAAQLQAIQQEKEQQIQQQTLTQAEQQRRDALRTKLQTAQTEKDRLRAVKDYYESKDQERIQREQQQQAEFAERQQQEQHREQIEGWNRAYESTFNDGFIEAINRRAVQQANGDIGAFQAARQQEILTYMMRRQMDPNLPSPYRNGQNQAPAPQGGNQQAYAPAQPQPQGGVFPQSVVPPSAGVAAQTSPLQLFQQQDFEELYRKLNMR